MAYNHDKNRKGEGGRSNEYSGPSPYSILKDEIPNLLKITRLDDGIKVKNLMDNIQEYVKHEGKKITTHQLRTLYNEVKDCKSLAEIQLRRHKFAYQAARQPASKGFIMFIDEIAKAMEEEEQVSDFINVFEAIVAYHKFYHGK